MRELELTIISTNEIIHVTHVIREKTIVRGLSYLNKPFDKVSIDFQTLDSVTEELKTKELLKLDNIEQLSEV